MYVNNLHGVALCRYMKWQLKDGVGLVVRCEYDAVLPPANKPTYISIKALNEWDSKVHVQ